MKWDTYEVDNATVAPAVIDRLLNSAFAHIMSNEASSHVVGKIRAELKPNGGKAGEVSTEAIKQFRLNPDHATKIAGWEEAFRTAKLAAIKDGTLSVRVARAPTRDPVEAAMRQIAKLEVTAVLRSNGAKFPGKDETVTIGNVELDGDELIDRRLGSAEHAPRIRQAAERKVREDNRMRENAAKAAVGGSGLSGLLS